MEWELDSQLPSAPEPSQERALLPIEQYLKDSRGLHAPGHCSQDFLSGGNPAGIKQQRVKLFSSLVRG